MRCILLAGHRFNLPVVYVAFSRSGAAHSDDVRLLEDLRLFGLLFESLVIRDLRVYAQAADARVLHYRDNTGLEIDAIVEAADDRWAAFDVKLGALGP